MMFHQCLLVSIVYMQSLAQENNVCKSFSDYYHPNNNENCFFDPDVLLETPELIQKYANAFEKYTVTSDDGYILTLFRIPRNNPRSVILLHHSIAMDSRINLWQGNDSFAITLWRNGYDVWLANQRGTIHSEKHVNMTIHDYRYWDFGFHEMGVYDLSKELELIRNKTNDSKVIYFGHSLGSAIGLVYSSVKSNEAKKYLKTMVLVGSPCFFKHVTVPIITIFAPYRSLLKSFLDLIQLGSPLIARPILLPISRLVLRFFPGLLYIANLLLLIFCGYTPNQTDHTFYNFGGLMYANNFPLKIPLYFLQTTQSDSCFQMYDYGSQKNLKMYGDTVPPFYPLENISVPTLLVSSYNDVLTPLKGSVTLFERFSPEAKIHGHWKLRGLNHVDYYIGLDRRKMFTNELMAFLNSL